MAKTCVLLACLAPFLFLHSRCDMNAFPQDPEAKNVRKAKFAGSWYEGTESGLRKQVAGFVDSAETAVLEKKVRGLISPHAGYVYSGSAAAVGYKTLRGVPVKRVIVLALSHRYPLQGASIADVSHYETPLGLIPLDREACDEILKHDSFSCVPAAHSGEHSLEIQLPFLQHVLEKGFSLIPVVIGRASSSDLKKMSAALLPYWDDETVVVASSDFTHYGAGFGYTPFRKDIPENLAKLDGGAVERIEAIDPEGFESYVNKTGATICGRKPIALLLSMAREKGYSSKKLVYTTSGEMTGDYSTSVSYVSMAFLGGNGSGGDDEDSARSRAAPDKPLLSGEEQTTLLELARHTLRTWVERKKEPDDLGAFAVTDNLKRELGVFVTLKIKGRLRGCIGYLQGRGPLYKAVIQNTINAASNDPRFPSVKPDEEPRIRIEISVLSPIRKVDDLEEIVVGRDGLIITRGLNRGTLLPQVAAEREWDRTKFLEETCFKAGLPKDAYKDPGTKIERYSAMVFGEDE